MTQQLLVSDANILIDMAEGGLLEQFFALPFEFIIPDILFEEELADEHPHFPELGLKLEVLSGELMVQAFEMITRHSKPSRNDVFAMCLAMNKGCPLLTGDRDLRVAAQQEGIVVKGTIGMVEAMIQHNIITAEQAKHSFQRMKEAGRRLPWELIEARISPPL
ncbi:PIN domain-containing protein [Pseudidiomarina sp. CB1]|uniref:PIN domain-containing protein n=1 Tax=Pseudidiomarina sp. CB1 TaxID=2972484 RepID=UPI0021628DC0|nr:PIN domain-containing protein [Pseudidiomarina sp. CB1]